MKTKKMPDSVRLLSAIEVAELLQVPIGTIYQWRSRGGGPHSLRVGRHIRFHPEDVSAWIGGRRGGR